MSFELLLIKLIETEVSIKGKPPLSSGSHFYFITDYERYKGWIWASFDEILDLYGGKHSVKEPFEH